VTRQIQGEHGLRNWRPPGLPSPVLAFNDLAQSPAPLPDGRFLQTDNRRRSRGGLRRISLFPRQPLIPGLLFSITSGSPEQRFSQTDPSSQPQRRFAKPPKSHKLLILNRLAAATPLELGGFGGIFLPVCENFAPIALFPPTATNKAGYQKAHVTPSSTHAANLLILRLAGMAYSQRCD